FTASNRFGRLRKLWLAGAFTAAAWSALANAPFADQLTNLALGYRVQTGPGTPPGPVAGFALARAPRPAGLDSLWVDDAAIGPEGLRELAASPHLAGLERFNLNGDRLDSTAGRVLADGFPAITHLSVTSSRLPDAAVEVLAGSPAMARLEGLRL